MHFAENPFAPHEDAPYNALLHENPLELTESLIKEHPGLFALPPHCTFEEISIKDNSKEIMDFINTQWDSRNYRLQMREDNINYFLERGDCTAFVVRFKCFIVALQLVEFVDININGTIYRTGFTDYYLIHPKFRKGGLANVFMALVFREILKRKGKIEIWNTYADIDSRFYEKIPIYNLALTNTPLTLRMCLGKRIYEPRKITKKTIREPTIEEMEIYNEIRYKMQLLYTPEMFKAILRHGKAYTDGKSHVMFMFNYGNVKNITIKIASMTNWVNLTKEFFREVIEDLRKDGVEIILVANNGTINDIIFSFDFTKINACYRYSLNILPKMKREEIMMNIR